jgi:hypothetical protein
MIRNYGGMIEQLENFNNKKKCQMLKPLALILVLILMVLSKAVCQNCFSKNDICYYKKEHLLLDSIGYTTMDIKGSVSCALFNESFLIKSSAYNAVGGCKIWGLTLYKIENDNFLYQEYYSIKTAFRKDFFIRVEDEFIYFMHESKIKKCIPISVNNLEMLDKFYIDFINQIGVWRDKRKV